MTRMVKALAIVGLLVGVSAANDMGVEEPELSAGEVMWRAAVLALEERGLAIQSASKEKRWIITELAALDPHGVSNAVVLNDQDQEVKWARAEYRYLIGFRAGSDNARPELEKERILVKAEVWAWDQGPAPRPEAKRVLESNQTLEREFMQAFTSALGRVDEK
jgi:hypothetical protein